MTALLLAGFGRAAFAQEDQSQQERSADAGFQVYSDSDDTTVVTLIGTSAWRPREDLSVDAHVTFDAISSASVDVISAASDRFKGYRSEFGTGVAKGIGSGTGSAKVVQSIEKDWLSTSLQLGWEQPLARKNAVLSLGYGATYNHVGDARPGYDFSETLWAHTWEVGFSQLVDRKTRVGVAHTGQYLAGYNASPYRDVVFTDGTRVAESHPDRRVRAALTASGHRYLGRDIGLSASYRFYLDSWGVVSHSLSAAVMFDFADRKLSLQLSGRGYTQSDAEFYRDQYDAPAGLEHWSFDKELASLWNAGGGAMLLWRASDTWRSAARLEGYYYGYRNFSELESRTALIAGLQLGKDW